jgi:hypothetical protein
MKQWRIDYKGHDIVVENGVSKERLFVDGELQHENFGLGCRSSLWGRLKTEEGGGSEVKVILGGWWRVQCRIFIDHKIIFHSKPDKKATELLNNLKKQR